MLKHTVFTQKLIKKIAICGGSGSFLTKTAIKAGAEVFLTADIKYHEYFDAEKKILLIDAGHFETEQFTPEIFKEVILKKFPKFAVHLSKTDTNPVRYFL